MADQTRAESVRQAGTPHGGIHLRLALAGAFVLHVLLVGGVVAFLSFRNSRSAVETVVHELRNETSSRIRHHVQAFLDIPRRINQINEAALRNGGIDAGDSRALERRFWDQVGAFDTISSIYFGNTAGGLADSGREGPGGELYVIGTDGFACGSFRKYATDDGGGRTRLLTTVPAFDARARDWYRNAVAKGADTWSEPYVLFTGQDMAIAVSRPVYDRQQRLLGVVSVDVFLTQLSDFLGGLRTGRTGQSFIVDHSGLLIASSTGERPFVASAGGGAAKRLAAGESTRPLVRRATEAIIDQYGAFSSISSTERLTFEVDDQRQCLEVMPVDAAYGVDWLVVTVVPESDFMGQIRASNRTTAGLVLIALLTAAFLGVVAARWLARPILRLNTSARALADGNWPEDRDDVSVFAEIRQLESSFSWMAGRIRETLSDLHHEAEERRKAMRSLQESEEHLGMVVAGADLGTWDWDLRTGAVSFNERWASMLGYPLDEISPQVDSWSGLLHPDERATVMATLADHLEGRTPVYQTEHRLRTKSGEWKWVLDTGKVLVRDAEGRPLRAAGTHQDVTSRKRVAEQLMSQGRLAAVGQLAAGIAHDFNNILTGIMGYSELLSTSPDMPKSLLPDLAVINAASQRGARLVAQILDFSQKSIRHPQRIDLNALVRQCIADLGPSIPKEVRLCLGAPIEGCFLEADASQLRQVVTNLVSNACDAMDGRGELRIELERTQSRGGVRCSLCSRVIAGEWLRLEVADMGCGIPAEVLPRVFEPFFTTKEIGKGSGLGLSQVAGIVAQHEGHVGIETATGHGTTVACYFRPLGSEDSDSPVVQAAAESGPGSRVLLVGNDSAEISAAESMLDRLGYGSLVARDGMEALRVVDSHCGGIRLVLADAVMPDMDGAALFDQLRSRIPDLRVAMVSSTPLVGRERELLERGAVDWLQRPFTFRMLSQELAEVIPRVRGRWS